MFHAQKMNTKESSTKFLLACGVCPGDDQLLAWERLAMHLEHQLQVIGILRDPYKDVERSVRCLNVNSWIDDYFYVRKAADWSHLEKSLQERLHLEEMDALSTDKAMFDAQKNNMERIFGLVKGLQHLLHLGGSKYKIINEMGSNLVFYRLEIRFRDDRKKDQLTYCTARFTVLEDCLLDAIRNLEQNVRQAEQQPYDGNGRRSPYLHQGHTHAPSWWNEQSESVEKLVNSISILSDLSPHSQVPTGEYPTYQEIGQWSDERPASASSSSVFASDAQTTMMQCMANLQLRRASSNSVHDHDFHRQRNTTEEYPQLHHPQAIRPIFYPNPTHHAQGRESVSATSQASISNQKPAVPRGRRPLRVTHSGKDGYEADTEPDTSSGASGMEVVQYSREGEVSGSALTLYDSEAETLPGSWDSGFE